METAYDYAKKLRKGDYGAVNDYPELREHPPLPRLLFADDANGHSSSRLDDALIQPPDPAGFGTLAVWLVAIVDLWQVD
jgi:hypothetical protein